MLGDDFGERVTPGHVAAPDAAMPSIFGGIEYARAVTFETLKKVDSLLHAPDWPCIDGEERKVR